MRPARRRARAGRRWGSGSGRGPRVGLGVPSPTSLPSAAHRPGAPIPRTDRPLRATATMTSGSSAAVKASPRIRSFGNMMLVPAQVRASAGQHQKCRVDRRRRRIAKADAGEHRHAAQRPGARCSRSRSASPRSRPSKSAAMRMLSYQPTSGNGSARLSASNDQTPNREWTYPTRTHTGRDPGSGRATASERRPGPPRTSTTASQIASPTGTSNRCSFAKQAGRSVRLRRRTGAQPRQQGQEHQRGPERLTGVVCRGEDQAGLTATRAPAKAIDPAVRPHDWRHFPPRTARRC